MANIRDLIWAKVVGAGSYLGDRAISLEYSTQANPTPSDFCTRLCVGHNGVMPSVHSVDGSAGADRSRPHHDLQHSSGKWRMGEIPQDVV